MKNNILHRFLLIGSLVISLQSFGQILRTGSLLPGPGCNAAQNDNWLEIDLPFPGGMTLSQLSHLSTKYMMIQSPDNAFLSNMNVDIGLYQIIFYNEVTSIQNTWLQTGNYLTISADAIFYDGFSENSYPYSLLLEEFGSYLITNIRLKAHAGGTTPHGIIKVDDTQINSILINYDDCDNDGMLDYYDCDPSVPQGQKMKICHNGNTICINSTALSAHLSHGDYQGPCQQVRTRTGEINEPTIINDFKISHAPNPAGSSVKLSYELPVDSKVSITLFDMSGRVITTIANGQQKAGVYNELIDVAKLSPGVYYYKITAEGGASKFMKTQKLVVAR